MSLYGEPFPRLTSICYCFLGDPIVLKIKIYNNIILDISNYFMCLSLQQECEVLKGMHVGIIKPVT